MPPAHIDTSDTETWGAYRKLIVETIRRLDERTLEMHDVQNKQESRIFVIEQKNYDSRLKELEDKLEKITIAMGEDRGRRTIINVLIGGGWAIGLLLLNSVIDGKLF